MAKREKNRKNNIKNGSKKNDILRSEDIIPPFDKDPEGQQSKQTKNKMDVPKFDLAEEIMAEHRKIASVKRKSPNQKIEPLRPIDKSKGQTDTDSSPISETIEEKQAIRDIVARDIERLSRGESLDISLATDTLGTSFTD